MTDRVLNWLIPFILGSIASAVGAAIGTIKARNKRMIALENGVQALLRAEIIRSYEKYEEKGYCPVYAREALQREYDSYHSLHGNDVATDLFNKIMALPSDRAK